MNKIKKIKIVFENCDEATLYPNMFKHLYIGGITKTYMINCFQYEKGELSKSIDCEYFTIEINSKSLNRITSDFKETLKERLKILDITHIGIFFLGKKERSEYISVPWKSGDNDFSNLNQKNEYVNGNLRIIIEEI